MYEPKDRRAMLRVKVKSLADEARIIRREERRSRTGWLKDELMLHRRGVVRSAARTAHVAYGIIKGVPLERIESPKVPRSDVFWKGVRTLVARYGPLDRQERDALVARCAEAPSPQVVR